MSTVQFPGNLSLEQKALRIIAVVLAVMLFASGCVYLFADTEAKPLSLVISLMALLGTAAAGIVFYLRFRSLPVVKRKRAREKEAKRLVAEARNNQKVLDAITAERKRIDESEVNDLAAREKKYQDDIAQLKTQIDNLVTEEKGKLSQSLQYLQKQFVEKGLRSYQVRDAKVSGVGPKFKEKLEANRIRTALDVSVNLVMSIQGFGEAKANALAAWRRELEQALVRNQPRRLPPEQEQAIRTHYEQKRLRIEQEIARNHVLVEEGYASSSTYPPDVACQDTFLAAQRKARENRAGFWMPTPTMVVYVPPALFDNTGGEGSEGSGGGCNCSLDYDCADFSTHAQAQACYDACGGNNWSRLDRDNDGLACESLP